MATTLSTWLVAGEAAPKAFEAKFTKAPKLTTVLNNIATHIPAGPAIYPNPPAGGGRPSTSGKIPNPPNILVLLPSRVPSWLPRLNPYRNRSATTNN